MDIKNNSSAGRVIRDLKGYYSFVPNPLPPQIEWDTALVSALSRADYALGKLAREGSKLPNPHILIRPFVAREAVLSSKIEGTRSTIGEVLAFSSGVELHEVTEDLREVLNYVTALEYVIKRSKELPLSLRLLQEMHGVLMQGVRGSYATPGEFRRSQNWIGAPGSTLFTAKFIPPSPEYMMDCLGDLELFFYNRELPPLIHVALCHYQLEAIHPFLDGNGRAGRLLITFLLMEHGLLPAPLLYLSAFFEATRSEYYALLFEVSKSGSWNNWLIYFLHGVAAQAEDGLYRSSDINALLDQWRLDFVATTRNQKYSSIVDYCAVNPYVNVKNIAQHFSIAYSTAQRLVSHLESLGIVKKVNDSKREKIYCAEKIVELVDAPIRIPV